MWFVLCVVIIMNCFIGILFVRRIFNDVVDQNINIQTFSINNEIRISTENDYTLTDQKYYSKCFSQHLAVVTVCIKFRLTRLFKYF